MSRNRSNLTGYSGTGERQIKDIADETIQKNDETLSRHLGYPEARDTSILRPTIGDGRMQALFSQCTFSVGGPIDNKFLGASTADIELKLIDWLLPCFLGPSLMGSAKNFTGHVTPGGSECNITALHFSLASLSKAQLFYSDQFHYSKGKTGSIVRLPEDSIHQVESHSDGNIDIGKLRKGLESAKAKRVENVVVFLTLATTVLGANDDIPAAIKAVDDAGFSSRHRKVIVDAAFYGPAYVLASNIENKQRPWFSHRIDFVWFSLHKFL